MGEVEFAALKGVDLHISKGEFVVILGPSGSGKSTMMNLLGCLDLPSKGTVLLNGKDISRLSESELATIRGKMIGFIFQQFNLIPTLNTLENVMLPLVPNADLCCKKEAVELLDLVGYLRSSKTAIQLQCQRQRVAIARSLAVDPDIYWRMNLQVTSTAKQDVYTGIHLWCQEGSKTDNHCDTYVALSDMPKG